MTKYYAFCLLYGLNAGIASGMISMPAIWACWGFYSKRIGLISSIGLAGKSIGPTVFGFLWAWLINPNNESIKNNNKNDQYFASYVNNNVPGAIRWVSLAYFITAIFGICMICNKKHEKSEEKENKTSMKLIEVIKQKRFWLLTMLFYFFYIFYVYLLSEYKEFGTTQINDDLFFTCIGAIGFLLGGMSRLLCGYFLDKFLWWKVALTSASIQICISLSIYYIVVSEVLYAVWVLIGFIFVSCTGLVLVMTCKAIYPHDDWILSYSNTGFTLLIGSLYAYQLLVFPIIGYQGTFFVMAGCLLASIIIILVLKQCKCLQSYQASSNPESSPIEAQKMQAGESTESNSSSGTNNNKEEQIITTLNTHKIINL
ncbi:unnamed protein product [Blepharisma stoltei]|uniref:Uncharacterized protein n=1 Tax=Blepharisma stoltei TaxID=1481888 RepID=A0AAU9IRH0_9CILI|nr:unnamed protein product [Blepharisma stoltei]